MKRLLFAFLIAIMALPAMAQDQPTRRVFGQALTTSLGATFDSVDFGFRSKEIQVCLRANSALTYIRFGTGTTLSTSTLKTSAQGNRMTVPVSTEAAFVTGVAGVMEEDALPMTTTTSGDTSSSNTAWTPAPPCFRNKWATNGLVIHSAGNATLDVWAY